MKILENKSGLKIQLFKTPLVLYNHSKGIFSNLIQGFIWTLIPPSTLE